MAVIEGNETFPYYISHTQDLYNLSDNLHGYLVNNYPPYASDSGSLPFDILDTVGHNLPIETSTYSISSGHLVNSYLNDYYFRIHISPNPLALGNILSDQTTFIEVWNAFFIDNPISSITGTNAEGITVTNIEGLATYAPLEYRIYNVSITKAGAININASILFNFNFAPLILQITGSRLLFWSFLPNIVHKEQKKFLTDVLTSISSESFLSLRDVPRVDYIYDYVFRTIEEYTLAKNLAHYGTNIGLATPVWWQTQRIPALTAGSTLIIANTANIDIATGDLGVIYVNYKIFELIEVLSFNSNTITTKLPILGTFPSCWYIPVKPAINERNITFGRKNGGVNSAEGTFNVMAGSYAPSFSGYSTFNSLPVITKATVVTGSLQEFSSRDSNYISNNIGDTYLEEYQNYTRTNQNVNVVAKGLFEIQILRKFLDYLRGRANLFYLPSFSPDTVPLLGFLATSATQVTVQNANLSYNPPKFIRAVGDISANFTVTDVTLESNGTETISFSPANPLVINNLKTIQILTKVRSQSDNFEIIYKASVQNTFIAQVTFPVIEVI